MRLKILEKKMTALELKGFLSEHERLRLPTREEVIRCHKKLDEGQEYYTNESVVHTNKNDKRNHSMFPNQKYPILSKKTGLETKFFEGSGHTKYKVALVYK